MRSEPPAHRWHVMLFLAMSALAGYAIVAKLRADPVQCPIGCGCKEVNAKATNMGSGFTNAQVFYEQDPTTGGYILSTCAIRQILSTGGCLGGLPGGGRSIKKLDVTPIDFHCTWDDPPAPGAYVDVEVVPPTSSPNPNQLRPWTQLTCVQQGGGS